MATSSKAKSTSTLTMRCGINDALEDIECLHRIERGSRSGVRQTPILLGPPGQGKSAIVVQYVNRLNRERENKIAALVEAGSSKEEAEAAAGPGWSLVQYRLSQSDPTDLKGVPVYEQLEGADGKTVEVCRFAGPAVFPFVGIPGSAEGKNVIIFLDELPQAPQTMQNLAANIIDGVVGDNVIDLSRCFIIVAGNRKEDMAATFDIPRNVGNRVIVYNVETTFSEWERWAVEQGVNPYVIGYLRERGSIFNEPPPEDGITYGTPRSWHRVAEQMSQLGDEWFTNEERAVRMVAGTVGSAQAYDFVRFARMANQDFKLSRILEGDKVKVPPKESKDLLYGIITEGTYWINGIAKEALAAWELAKTTATGSRGDWIMEFWQKKGHVRRIVNLYKWTANAGIDPAYQVLLNKYQTPEANSVLRPLMLMNPAFEEVGEIFTNMTKLMSGKK